MCYLRILTCIAPVSQVSESIGKSGDREEGIIDTQPALVANSQPTDIAQLGEVTFDYPATPIAAQRPAILRWNRAPVLAKWTDQLDTALLEAAVERFAVVGPVNDEPLRLALGPAPSSARHAHLLEGSFDQLHFHGRRAGQVVSQWTTLAVDSAIHLVTLPRLVCANAVAPILARINLPSMKLSLRLSCPRRSSSAINRRHTFCQMPSSSHWWRRCQQVAGLTSKSEGRSRQRAPLRRIQRMPSSTTRLSFSGRPTPGYRGKCGSSLAHCLSDKMGFAMPSVSRNR